MSGWLQTEVVYPPADGHHPSTNRARGRVTSLIENNALPLSQAANHDRELCKMAEPILMPIELWTPVGPRSRALDGVQIPMRRGSFDGEMGGPL